MPGPVPGVLFTDTRCVRSRRLARLLPWLALCGIPALPAVAAPLAIAYEDSGGEALVQVFSATSPWQALTPALAVDGGARLTYADGRLYALSRAAGTVTVIDIGTWSIHNVFTLGAGGVPVDLAVRSNYGYVTREGATRLLRIDLRNGSTNESVDFSPLADSDGVPDLGTMIFDGERLLVQVRRVNENALEFFERPAWIALVDVASETLVDVDPVAAGVQGIELQGTAPFYRMQVGPRARRLFVSASMNTHNVDAGIEMIDLDANRSLGIVAAEVDAENGICCDMAPFLMVSPSRGYFTISTDSTLSLHLHTFTIEDGHDPRDFYTSVGFEAPGMVHDSATDQLFVPVLEEGPGFHVFDAATGERRSKTIVPTDGLITDLVQLCACSDLLCDSQLQCPNIPATSAWSRPVLVALLGGIAVLVFRRRRPAR